MSNRILVFYGFYRSDRMGIRLAEYVVERLRRRGGDVDLIDAKAIDLPILDRMYKKYPKGQAPAALEELARKIRGEIHHGWASLEPVRLAGDAQMAATVFHEERIAPGTPDYNQPRLPAKRSARRSRRKPSATKSTKARVLVGSNVRVG